MTVLGIADPWIWGVLVLIVVFTLICIVYGIMNWNEWLRGFIMRIKEDIIKMEVIDDEAKVLGKVSDVIMDKDTFEITDLVINKSSGFNNAEDVIPMDLVKVIGDKIILKGEFDL